MTLVATRNWRHLGALFCAIFGGLLPLSAAASAERELDAAAEAYVKLALAAGVHDGDFVDAYHGPAGWQQAAEAEKRPLAAVRAEAGALRQRVAAIDGSGLEEILRLRHEYLGKQLRAMEARLELVEGKRRSFDEESALLYDAVAPTHPDAFFEQALAELEAMLPGPGPISERIEAFRKRFVIPPEKLDTVFQAAIAAARERSGRHIALPAGESFVIEYVTDKPWGGYNWYKGGYHSVIQINTSLPIYIDRAIDLACHEGYPGHHVYNVLLEQKLLRERGWVEFSVYPLFSPQSLIAEGTANYGVDVAFPEEERKAFERDVLYPLAGLDPATAADYERLRQLTRRLGYSGNEAARRFLNGERTAEETMAWLVHFGATPQRARQNVRFYEKYRSYVINYNLGEDLVRDYLERRAGGDVARRWAEFAELISSPRLPSGLK